jgi:opacity protein-like surface antigen
MGEENHIDKLFRSAMEPMNVDPGDKSRIAIEAELEKKRSVLYEKRIKTYRTVAAVLTLLLVSFAAFYISENNNTQKLNKVETETNSENIQNNTEIKSNYVEAENKIVVTDENKRVADPENPDEMTIKKGIFSDKKNINNNKIAINNLNNSHVYENYTEINSKADNNFILNEALIEIAVIPVDPEIYTLPAKTNSLNDHSQYAVSLPENNIVNTASPVSLLLFYSPNYSYCLLKDNTPDLVDDVQMYKDQETPGFSYSTGFAMRYNLAERWGLSAGVTYSTVTKSISLLTVYAAGTSDNMYYEYHTSSGMIEIPDPENAQIKVGDSLNLLGDGVKILKFVSIPLMTRYVISKEKVSWYFNGGFSVNFLVQDQAKINTRSSEEIVNNKTQGLKKTSYGFVVGAGMEYKVFDNINLVLEPVYKGTVTSITDDAAVKNYPYSIGINLGVSIGF